MCSSTVGVDAAGEPDEPVDRGERQADGERMLPERDADERAAGRQDERRTHRENREDLGNDAVRGR